MNNAKNARQQTNSRISEHAVRIDSDVSFIAQKSSPVGTPPTNAIEVANNTRPGSVRSAIDPPVSAPIIEPLSAQIGMVNGANERSGCVKFGSVIAVFDVNHGTTKFSECEEKSSHKSERLTEHFAAIFCSSYFVTIPRKRKTGFSFLSFSTRSSPIAISPPEDIPGMLPSLGWPSE